MVSDELLNDNWIPYPSNDFVGQRYNRFIRHIGEDKWLFMAVPVGADCTTITIDELDNYGIISTSDICSNYRDYFKLASQHGVSKAKTLNGL